MKDAAEALARLAVPFIIVALLLVLAFRRPLGRQLSVADGPEDEVYQVYTRQFDLVIPAAQVLDKLDAASPDGANGWLRGAQVAWSARQVESLLASQRAALAPDR